MHIVRNVESHPPIPIEPPCTLIVCARVFRQHHESSYALVLHKQPVDNEWREGKNANTASTHTHVHTGGGCDSQEGLRTVLLGHPLPLDLRRHGEPAGGAPQGGTTAVRVDVRVHRHFLLNNMRTNWG